MLRILSLLMVVTLTFVGCGSDEEVDENLDSEETQGDEISENDQTNNGSENSEKSNQDEDSSELDEADSGVVLSEYYGKLDDVSGGEGTGYVSANFVPANEGVLGVDKYYLEVTMENIPEAEEGFFYEGWLVRANTAEDGENNASVISTGEAIFSTDDTALLNNFESEEDLTDHTLYVLTLEPDDGDPAPAKHILEGVISEVE